MFVKASLVVPHVQDIDLLVLKDQGIRGFIFDLDNTLMIPHTGVLDEPVTNWLGSVHEEGFRCVVVSNNHQADYIRQAEEILGFPAFAKAAKPRRRFLRKALEILEMDPHEVAVVGDRPLTDIWGGQRLGAYTILVDPLNKLNEPDLIKVLRWMERLVIRHPIIK